MRTNADLTLYNKVIVAGKETYQRTQISAVEWENRKASNVLRTGGNIAADQAVVYIPFGRTGYLKPQAWLALDEREDNWTLQVGDYIVKGLVEDEIHDPLTSPPLPAFTITNLRAKYDDVLQITSVDTMDMGSAALRHWKVSAK